MTIAFSVDQAAAETGHSAAQIREAIRDGKLAARVSGDRLIILAGDLQSFVARLPSIHDLSARASAEAAAAEAAASRERGRQITLRAKSAVNDDRRFERGRQITLKFRRKKGQ